MSLKNCISKAGDHLDPTIKKQLLARADELRGEGLSELTAADAAIDEQIAAVRSQLDSDASKSAPRQTDTPEFKKWFGDSQAVMAVNAETGEPVVSSAEPKRVVPMTMYHTTRNSFAEFEVGRTSTNSGTFGDWEVRRSGIFFTPDLAQSESYGKSGGRFVAGANVMPVYLRAANPLDLTGGLKEGAAEALAATGHVSARFLYNNVPSWENFDDETGEAFAAAVKAAGYDSVIFNETDPDSDETFETWVVFEPEQIKSATGNDGSFDPKSKDITKSTGRIWYSQLQQALAQAPAKFDGAAAPMWAQWLKANAAKLGVRQEEITWSGIEDYLKLRGKDKLSREELAAWVGENGVKVEEVVRGANPLSIKQRARLIELERDGPQDDAEEAELARLLAMDDSDARDGVPPQYGQYTLPGGENYREVLLTLPENSGTVGAKFQAREVAGGGAEVYDRDTGRMVERATTLRQAVDRATDYNRANPNTPLADKNYRSSHWSQPNVLAHIRLNDRTDADGARVLFVEELQSDWGQDGKKRGFAAPPMSPAERERLRADLASLKERRRQLVAADRASGAEQVNPETERILDEEAALQSRINQAARDAANGLPLAPFVTKTDGWLNLALKRVIKLAVDGGYDKVAFVTGEQSAERYDLSKQIDSIDWIRHGSADTTGYGIVATRGGVEVVHKAHVEPGEVDGLLGKEIAQKIVESDKNFGTLSGLDLKVGGRGMLEFYDTLVPNAVRGLLKKLGGEGLTTVGIELPQPLVFATTEEAQAFAKSGADGWQTKPQPGFAITDKMRERAADGMPLFSAYRSDPALEAWADDALSGRKGERFHAVASSLPHPAWLMAGLDSRRPVTVDLRLVSHLKTHDHPEITPAIIGRLAALMANPRAMIRNEAVDDNGRTVQRYQALVDARDEFGRPILVAVRPSQEGVRGHAIDVYDVRTMFGREESMQYMIDQLRMGNVVWMADEEVTALQEFMGRATIAHYPPKRSSRPSSAATTAIVPGDAAAANFPAKGWKQNGNKITIPPDAWRRAQGVAFSRSRATETPEFKAWFGKSKVVDVDGEPLVMYHGSTHDFTAFKPRKANPGNDFGRGIYATSSAEDASTNYAGEGPDLTNRIETRAEQIASDKGWEYDDPRAVELARRELAGGAANVMPLYVRIENPLMLGGDDPTWMDERAAGKFARAVAKAVRQFAIDTRGSDARPVRETEMQIDDLLEAAMDGADAEVLIAKARNAAAEVEDLRSGDLIGPEVVRKAIQHAGYDGIIDHTVSAKWGADSDRRNPMAGVDWDTVHVIAFRADQVKSATGNRGSFDAADPDITKSGMRAFDAPEPSRFDNVVYAMSDKHVDTKRVVEAVKKTQGEIRDDLDVYLQEELFHGRAAKRTEDFVHHELQPLVEQMRDAGLSVADLDEFLHARHAREANAVIAQRNPEIQDGGSGMLNQDAAAYFAELPADKRRQLEAAAAQVDAMLAATRKLMVDYELESTAKVQGWAEMFEHYVPLMREDDGGHSGNGTGQGYSIRGKEVKSRTGSTRKVVDILANIALQRERTIVRGEKNRVSRALFGLAAANPNADFWTVDTHIPSEPVYNPATGLVEDRPDTMYKMRPNVITTKIADEQGNVSERAVVFNEKDERAMRMSAALKNLDAAQLEGLLGASAKLTRYFASVNTQFNPVFGVVNLVRDVQGALVNLGTTEIAGKQKDVARQTLSALRGIYGDLRATRKGGTASSRWAQLWEEFQQVGGQTGYRQLFATSNDRADAIKSAIDPHAWMDSKLGKIFTAGGALKVPLASAQRGAKWIFDWLSDYNSAMENGVRLAAYKTALDAGLSKERAASLAKNLTVNFNRKGQVAQQAGALYAFFNASMQGTARMGQVLVEMEPGKPKTIRLSGLGKKVVYGGMLLGSVQALALAAAGFGDDDPPEWARERNLIIPTGGKTYVSIPLPLGLHVIPNIGRSTTAWALGGFKDTPKRVVGLFGSLADAFNPIGNAGLSIQTIAPTAIDPLVALTENKDWSGRPITRESSNKAVPGHALARDTASSVGKLLSEGINTLSGGTKYTAGVLSPSPEQIDYLIGQITGGVGRELSKVEQTALGAVRGENVPLYKVPLVGRLVGNAAGQSSEGSAFYANVDRLNEIETEIKGLKKDGKTAEANAVRMNNPQAYMITQANHAERQVQKLRREKSELIKAGAPREQVKAIEEKITARMAALNRAVEKLRAE